MPDTIEARQLESYLAEIDRQFNDFDAREALTKAEPVIAGGMMEHILKSVAPGGSPYQPLSPRTIARKGNKGAHQSGSITATPGSIRPLVETGKLIQSLTSGSDHIEDIESDYLATGTSVGYAAYHEYGTGRIPARPFAGLTPEAEAKTLDYIADHVVRGLTK